MQTIVDIKMLLSRMSLLTLMLLGFYVVGHSENDEIKTDYEYDSNKLDSLNVLIASYMESNNFQQAAAVSLDKGKLMFDYGMYINAVMVLDNGVAILNKINEKSRDEQWNDVYVDCVNWKGTSLAYLSNFNEALECYITIEKFNDNKSDKYAAKACNGMGIVFAMSNNSELAEEYYRKALSIAKRDKTFNLFPIYSNLGAIFMTKRAFDSAQSYFLDAHKMALLQKNKSREIASLQFLGMVNYQLGKCKLSLKYYNEAVDIANEEKNYSQLSFLKFNMVGSYIALGDYSSAFSTANEALLLARKNGGRNLEAASLRQLADLYEMRGDYKKALEYIKKSLVVNDSIFSYDNENKLLRQKADFDLYRIQSEQALRENEFALELANRKINNMITWFFLIILAIGLYVVSSKLLKQYRVNRQLNSRIEHIQIDDESRRGKLQEEIEMKSRELTSTSLLVVKFNELSYLLNTKLRILKANLAPRSKDMEVIREMEELIQQFAPEKSWEQFKHHFEQISPDFYDKLDILYPDMTLGEKRICALLSLNLTSKEIASLMGKTSGAIENAKCRIRKKMDVGVDVNLSDIFSKMKE